MEKKAMKKLLMCGMIATVFQFAMLCPVVQAEGTGSCSDKAVCGKEKPALADMTVTGKVTKEDKQGKEGKTITCYILTDTAGNTVMLSGGGKHGKHHKDAQAISVNLEEYVNKDVTIVGKGFQKEKDGKKMTRLVEITKIDIVTSTPAAQ
jgi:hypothetical protein